MKKLLFGLSLILGLTFANTVLAQEVLSEETSGPVLEIDKVVHDYGKINKGDNGTCTFKVTNTGNEPLIISLCKGSCGCTVPACPKEPIAPGATSEIKVKYDTNRVGPINKSVTITSNAVNEPSKRIRISGNIVDTAAVKPVVDPK